MLGRRHPLMPQEIGLNLTEAQALLGSTTGISWFDVDHASAHVLPA